MVGVVELPTPTAVGNAMVEGEGGASNEIRTAMESMEVGDEGMAQLNMVTVWYWNPTTHY